jgi:chromosome segregation ATPase
LWHQLLEKEAEVVALEEDSKNLSCMSTAKEEEELAAHQAELEVLRSELQQISRTSAGKEEELSESRKEIGVLQTELQTKQALLQEVEAKLLETVEASEQLIKEKDEKIAALKEESERMSCMSVKKEDGEVVEMRRKLESLQEEIRAKERTLEELERQLLESVHASRTLGKEKDEEISELKAEINRLSCMYSENSGELSRLREELQAVQSELETRESLLQELQTHAGQADAALEKLAGEKVLLEAQLESTAIEANVAASRLCEAEEAQSVLQDKVAAMEARIVEYEDKEQALMMELEELSTVRNMSDEDVIQLQNEVVELRRERDSLNLEVSTMDMQSAISDRLQLIQSMCVDTDDRITSMQSEIEDATSAKKTLEAEVQSIEARAAHLLLELAEREESLEAARKDLDRVRTELMDASGASSTAQSAETQGSREELAAAESKLQAAVESIESMSKTIDDLNKSRADKEDECVLLQERLEKARANRMQAQDKLDALTVVMHEFSMSEESWRNEKGRIVSEIEMMKSQLAEKEAQFLALQEEKGALETRLQVVAAEKDAALASMASLESRAEKSEAIGKSAGKDVSSDTDEVELAKARAALAGAEEKVKLLVDANATMTDEWEGERSRLNADKELLQLEISRLEKPVLTALDQNNSTPEERFVDELKQVVKRSSAECEKLRSQLRERDNTILSVRLQLEEAIVCKTIREKEDAIARIAELEAEVTNAQEEIMRRREQVESFDLELENVVVRVTDSEAQWRAERDQLESERDDARAKVIEVECELRDELERERAVARAEADENAALRKRIEETKIISEKDEFSGQVTGREVEESVNLSLESIAAFAVAKEEVDLTKNHCEKEMETLAVDMKSLRADISSSFFEFPVVEIQEDVKSIIEAHRIEIASLTQKVEGLESLLADSTTKVSTLQVALQNAQEVLQMSVGEGECVGSANSRQAADIASACADLENTRVELQMSEVAVSQLLAAVSERDATLSVLESTLKETQERLAQIEAELAANQEDARAAKLALSDADQLRTQVLALQRQVAQKEELIKGLEYDINLVEESGAAEAENATKTIGQLQKELDEKSGEMERLRDQTATLESELGERIKALTSMEEDLVATNANAAEAAIENSNLRARVAGLESQMASLDALVKEEESVIRSLKSELETARSLIAESEAVAAKARQVTNVLRMCAPSLFSPAPTFL